MLFDHEKLTVYHRSLEFIEWVIPSLESLPKSLAAKNQLDRASTSVVLNIAEGNGKFGESDRFKYFDITSGSAVECAACLDVLSAKRNALRSRWKRGKSKYMGSFRCLLGCLSGMGKEGLIRRVRGMSKSRSRKQD